MKLELTKETDTRLRSAWPDVSRSEHLLPDRCRMAVLSNRTHVTSTISVLLIPLRLPGDRQP